MEKACNNICQIGSSEQISYFNHVLAYNRETTIYEKATIIIAVC